MPRPEVLPYTTKLGVEGEGKNGEKGSAKARFETSQEFLIERLQGGVAIRAREEYKDPLTSKNQELDARAWDLLGRYWGTDATLEQSASKHGLTRERVRQINKGSIKKLHQTAPPELQEKYPLNTLRFNKSWTLESRKRSSLSHGGTSARVMQAVQEGSSNAEQIRKNAQINSTQLSQARLTLQKWGVKVPYVHERGSLEYQEKLERLADPDISDQEAKAILDSISHGTYYSHSRGENPLLTPLTNAARGAGLHFRSQVTPLLIQALQEADPRIPMGVANHEVKKTGQVLRYYFISSGHRDRAQEAFLNNPALDKFKKNPVEVLGSSVQKIPNTTDLMYSRKYKFVGSLLKTLGVSAQSLGIRTDKLITAECPIPIFRLRQRFYFDEKQQETLCAFLTNRIQQLEK